MPGTLSTRWRKLMTHPVGYCLDSRFAPLRALGGRMRDRERAQLLAAGSANADVPVTVVMTAYNTGHLIEKAVQSVLDQSHTNLRLMVIDDASTDETAQILLKLAATDKRLTVVRSSRNHGTYWSKNWCLAQADTDFVAFHDSDDVSDPDRIRIQLGYMIANPNAMACTVRWQRVDEDGRLFTVDGKTDRNAVISTMIRRQPVLQKAGFFDCVRIAADTEFQYRLRRLFGYGAVHNLYHVLYTGLLRSGSLTTGVGSGFTWEADGMRLDRTLHGNRALYHQAHTEWHASADAAALRLSFPPAARPFPVPADIVRGADDPDASSAVVVTPA